MRGRRIMTLVRFAGHGTVQGGIADGRSSSQGPPLRVAVLMSASTRQRSLSHYQIISLLGMDTGRACVANPN